MARTSNMKPSRQQVVALGIVTAGLLAAAAVLLLVGGAATWGALVVAAAAVSPLALVVRMLKYPRP